jgi:enterochelin esterase-like enzyme
MISRRTLIAQSGACSMIGGQAFAAGQDFITFPDMASRYIGSRNVQVWLPPGYEAGQRRYPVIYFHDGQNAFSPVYGFRGQYWGIGSKIAARMGLDGRGGAIVVAIWNTAKRRSDYAPNGIEARLAPAARAQILAANEGPSQGDDYLNFLVRELKPFIDARFRTVPTRAATSLMGASRGGMISLYGLCEHPEVFGAAACLSTHWLLLPPRGPATAPLFDVEAVTTAVRAYLREKLPNPGAHKIWMDHGTLNLDSFYSPFQQSADRDSAARGWVKGQHFESRVYEGADHNEAAWRARLDDPLDFILGPVA